jgi:diguanylate cyclase (GGDEF)-like protein
MQLNYDDEALRNLVFLINFGLIAASIITLAYWMPAYLAYMIPQSVTIFYVFLQLNTEHNLESALAFFIFTMVMISTSMRFNERHKNEANLLLKNKLLIDNLNQEVVHRKRAQEALEDNKRQLEIKVDERTKDLVSINSNLKKVIEDKVIAEESLQYLAYHDELTGLPNRNLLLDRVGQSIKTSLRENQNMALLFLDLDRFKTINDSLGHAVGDRLLQDVSSRLYNTLRGRDTISRNGSDEFVVVLERLEDANEAINVANKIISRMTKSFHIQSHKIHLGASIGISIYPHDGSTPLELLRNADTAMYRAKQAGGNQLQFYDESMSNQLRNRLEIESELHNALIKDEFYMVYQPQVNCSTGKIVGFESLLRWNNKKHGDIGPEQFVPLLEETGLIYSVGEWIVTNVIDFVKTHNIEDVKFSINLSSLQCNNLNFLDHVNNEIEKANIDPNLVEFEITESLLIEDFDRTRLFLDEIHSIGCSIALDDFGTGYTSMNYLAHLPVDVIKIDRSLVRNINRNNNLRSIVNAIVTMSKGLGVKNIFEGVEATSELTVIKEMDGNIIQGYLFSKPLNPEKAAEWLSKGKILQPA